MPGHRRSPLLPQAEADRTQQIALAEQQEIFAAAIATANRAAADHLARAVESGGAAAGKINDSGGKKKTSRSFNAT